VVPAEAKAKAKARGEAATADLDECVLGCQLNSMQPAGETTAAGFLWRGILLDSLIISKRYYTLF
jgi:hypothetical protein